MRWVNFSLLVPKFPSVAPRPLFKKALAVTPHELGHRCSPAVCSQRQSPREAGSPWAASATTKIEDQAFAGSDGYSGKTERGAVSWSPPTCFSRRFYRRTPVAFSSHLLHVFLSTVKTRALSFAATVCEYIQTYVTVLIVSRVLLA